MDNNKKQYPTQLVLTIRAIVGGYVLYQSYQILTSGDEKSLLMYLLTGVLIIGGVLILGTAIKQFVRGEYEGGKADISGDEEMGEQLISDEGANDNSSADELDASKDVSEEYVGEIEELTDVEIIEEGNLSSKALDFSHVNSIETVRSGELENLD